MKNELRVQEKIHAQTFYRYVRIIKKLLMSVTFCMGFWSYSNTQLLRFDQTVVEPFVETAVATIDSVVETVVETVAKNSRNCGSLYVKFGRGIPFGQPTVATGFTTVSTTVSTTVLWLLPWFLGHPQQHKAIAKVMSELQNFLPKLICSAEYVCTCV